MSKPGWKTCACGRRTRHESGVCVTCARARRVVPLAPNERSLALTEFDPLPGGCQMPTYVRPERRKECPLCGNTRDNLPEKWSIRLEDGSLETKRICEWCFERLWLLMEHNEDGYIVHGGCPCPTCTMHREKMLEASHQMKALKSGTSAP